VKKPKGPESGEGGGHVEEGDQKWDRGIPKRILGQVQLNQPGERNYERSKRYKKKKAVARPLRPGGKMTG